MSKKSSEKNFNWHADVDEEFEEIGTIGKTNSQPPQNWGKLAAVFAAFIVVGIAGGWFVSRRIKLVDDQNAAEINQTMSIFYSAMDGNDVEIALTLFQNPPIHAEKALTNLFNDHQQSLAHTQLTYVKDSAQTEIVEWANELDSHIVTVETTLTYETQDAQILRFKRPAKLIENNENWQIYQSADASTPDQENVNFLPVSEFSVINETDGAYLKISHLTPVPPLARYLVGAFDTYYLENCSSLPQGCQFDYQVHASFLSQSIVSVSNNSVLNIISSSSEVVYQNSVPPIQSFGIPVDQQSEQFVEARFIRPFYNLLAQTTESLEMPSEQLLLSCTEIVTKQSSIIAMDPNIGSIEQITNTPRAYVLNIESMAGHAAFLSRRVFKESRTAVETSIFLQEEFYKLGDEGFEISNEVARTQTPDLRQQPAPTHYTLFRTPLIRVRQPREQVVLDLDLTNCAAGFCPLTEQSEVEMPSPDGKLVAKQSPLTEVVRLFSAETNTPLLEINNATMSLWLEENTFVWYDRIDGLKQWHQGDGTTILTSPAQARGFSPTEQTITPSQLTPHPTKPDHVLLTFSSLVGETTTSETAYFTLEVNTRDSETVAIKALDGLRPIYSIAENGHLVSLGFRISEIAPSILATLPETIHIFDLNDAEFEEHELTIWWSDIISDRNAQPLIDLTGSWIAFEAENTLHVLNLVSGRKTTFPLINYVDCNQPIWFSREAHLNLSEAIGLLDK